MKPPLDLFPQDLKILIRIIVMLRVLTQLFLLITSQNLSKIQNFRIEVYASLQLFQGQSPTVFWVCGYTFFHENVKVAVIPNCQVSLV